MRPSALPGVLALSLLAATLSALSVAPAQAATTVSPTQAGDPPVVRDSTVTVSADRAALSYYRGGATAAFAPQAASAFVLNFTTCRGDLPTGTNNSPRTTITVKGPDGSTLADVTSPVRDLGFSGFTSTPAHQPLPAAAPSATNYRGDFPDAGAFHGLSTKVDLTGKPAGTYTVTTTNINKVKTGILGACATGTPVSNGNGGFTNAAPVPGPQVTTQTFEYRPWQTTFVDVFGGGKVQANVTPAEFTFSVGAKRAPVYVTGPDQEQQFFGLPGGTGFALPSDPAACAADAASCLPPTAVPCDPAAGCTPRIMVVNRPTRAGDPNGLLGVFDLETKAFIATATVDGSTRPLLSVGTDNDKVYRDLLTQLSDGAAAQGIDLAKILATEVSVGTGTERTSLSLLNGLQVDPSSSPGGVQIRSDATAQAGIVLNVYSSLRTTGGVCVANSGSSAAGTGRYARKEDNGYVVTKSDLLPSVPSVGPLGAFAGGQPFLVKGTFKDGALVNTSSTAVGVDTAAGEPNGYPVWLSPFVSGVNTGTKARTMEFLGTGTWSASETPLLSGCLSVNLLLGTGVAVFNNPLPVGLGTLFDPLATETPAAQQLTDAIDDVVAQVTGGLTTDPTVSSLLDQIVALLPLA